MILTLPEVSFLVLFWGIVFGPFCERSAIDFEPDDQRRALAGVADAMEALLSCQPLQEHLNRGLRGGIVAELGGDLEQYKAAFRQAGQRERLDDRARVSSVGRPVAAAL